jgi:hypothetical protein
MPLCAQGRPIALWHVKSEPPAVFAQLLDNAQCARTTDFVEYVNVLGQRHRAFNSKAQFGAVMMQSL